MRTYLFAWNPKKWDWKTLKQKIVQTKTEGHASEDWSVASFKKIRKGDRAFLMRLGQEPKGIMGAGYVATNSFPTKHWSGENKIIYRVTIDFDVLLNPYSDQLLNLQLLNQGNLAKVKWTPQSSGVEIPFEFTAELEKAWNNLVMK